MSTTVDLHVALVFASVCALDCCLFVDETALEFFVFVNVFDHLEVEVDENSFNFN